MSDRQEKPREIFLEGPAVTECRQVGDQLEVVIKLVVPVSNPVIVDRLSRVARQVEGWAAARKRSSSWVEI